MASPTIPLETWAGVESTVNRVGDEFFDQCRRTRHHDREGDLKLLADLGIAALRYPVLWERVVRDGWDWSDQRLDTLRQLRVRPIVGLVHHGSGPIGTSLVDDRFPTLFTEHALACARRYPWVTEWTPINEPLTTARFSGLYGVWYPHGRDDQTFIRCLLNQCKATVMAMHSIRSVIPHARLVQTEDLGRTVATLPLAYQADLENHRRWLSLDLLCGRFTNAHPLWEFLAHAGATQSELEWFLDHPCPPDIVGINYYLTSERWLDHRLDMYPKGTHGGNGSDAYADVESVRAHSLAGPRVLLREAWDRYGLPLAVTEAHLHSPREDQLRWLHEIFTTAHHLRQEGVELRAVCAWAAFGLYDWDSLVTCDRGHYEPGLFDVRGPTPRPTALARMVSTVAHGGTFDHPTLPVPGWWRREGRLFYHPKPVLFEPVPEGLQPLLITGKTGTLGRSIASACQARGIPHILTAREDMDLGDPASITAALDRYRPWAVVNAAGYVNVTRAEQHCERCWRENCTAPTLLAEACDRRGLQSVFFSSNLVFDGMKDRPYVESDETRPRCVYGQCKAAAEKAILAAAPEALIVRTAAFFSPWDEYNFVTRSLFALAAREPFQVQAGVTVSPTYVPDLVNAVLDLLIDRESGIWHVTNDGEVTWLRLAQEAARLIDIDPSTLDEVRPPTFIPEYSAMTSERTVLLRSWSDALLDYSLALKWGPDHKLPSRCVVGAETPDT